MESLSSYIITESVSWELIVAAAFCSCVSGFCHGGAGFGGHIMFQVCWNASGRLGFSGLGDVKTAVAVMSVSGFVEVVGIWALPSARKAANYKIALSIWPGATVMVYVGTYALVTLQMAFLNRILGLSLVALSLSQFALYMYTSMRIKGRVVPVSSVSDRHLSNKYDSDSESVQVTVTGDRPQSGEVRSGSVTGSIADAWAKFDSYYVELCLWLASPWCWAAVGVGCVSGFLYGAFRTGGPPIVIFFTFLNLDKDAIKGTNILLNLLQQPTAIISMFLYKVWRIEQWSLYVAGPIGSSFGMWVGNRVHHRINNTTAVTLIRLTVLFGSMPLIGVGDGTEFGNIMVFAYGVIGMVVIGVPCYFERLEKREIANQLQSK